MKRPTIIDFETKAIQPRPHYPPEPVGVAIKRPGRKPHYYAWGHPSGNNCTREDGRRALAEVWHSGTAQHNSKFDLDVGRVHMGLEWPTDFHDTMILAYLDDPHNRQISAKELAVRYLNRGPTERDLLKAWILKNVKEAKPSTWGAYISRAPAELVAPYAEADTLIADGLLNVLLPRIQQAGMEGAYARERALLKVLVGMEERGIPVDLATLERDVQKHGSVLAQLNRWVFDYLGTNEFNVDSADELANALDASGKASDWRLTPTGKRSTSKDSIRKAISDDTLVMMLDYRSTLANYLRNFMEPWLRVAKETNGLVYTQWHSTKQEEKGGSRTGRLSSTPNLQNVPSDERWEEANGRFSALFKKFRWLLPLPHVRNYVQALKSKTLIARDYSQQEVRVLAHFEDGELCESYVADPRMDAYIAGVRIVAETTGLTLHDDPKFARKIMKTVVLSIMYGQGVGALAEKLGIPVIEARRIRDAIMRALPGVKNLTKDLKSRGQNRLPMKTWGGRVYFAEPPRMIKGQMRDFNYKLINYLIQGSSADITKEAMIRYDARKKYGELLVSVHDELLVVCPERHAVSEMKILKNTMDTIELDAPLVSDGFMGQRWGELREVA